MTQTASNKINTAEIRAELEREARQAAYFDFVNGLDLKEFSIKQTHYAEDNPDTYIGIETEILNHSVESYGSKAFRLEPVFKPEKGELEKLAEFANSLFPDEVQEVRLFIKTVYGADFLSSAYQILSSAKRKKQSLKRVNSYLQGLVTALAIPVEREIQIRGEKETVEIFALPCSHLAGTMEAPELPYFSDFIEESETGFIPDSEIAELPTPKPSLKSAAHADGLSRQLLGYDAKQRKALINEELNASKGKKPTWFNICLKWQKLSTWEELQEARKSLPGNKGLKNLFFDKVYNPKKKEIIREQVNSDEFYKRVEDFFKRCIASKRELSPRTKQTFKRVKLQIVQRKPPQPLSNYLFNLRKEVEKLN